MPVFHYRVRDRSRRVIAENDVDEPDFAAACRAVAVALAFFTFSQQAFPDATIELDDADGRPVTRISLRVETV